MNSVDACAACGTPTDTSTGMVGIWTPPWSMVAGVVAACGRECFRQLEDDGWHPATEEEKARLLADSSRYGRRVDETEIPGEGP